MGNQQGWAALEFTVRLVQVSNGRGEHMGLAFANRRGLLKTEFSSRSLTVLSGRVTEWSDRKIGYFIRKASTSRVHSNWDASAVQLDPNTWILEYESSLTLDNSMLFSAVAGVFKYRMSRALKSMNPGFWLFSDFECQYSEIIPT